MHHALAQAVLAHTMAQSTLELLALIGPFAVIFGAGAVLVIGPVIRDGQNRYSSHQATATEQGAATPDPVATADESPAAAT
ncbi:MAG TPA: hypothetical protein VMU20_15415 [Candidatus Dormibacteraeota bacterium]|jgi:TPP-dependent trihydroxycyclohexane-1,2-dione (THcHDO) dehydratase|nr:hypothetical protein [Candidatus Dormibacteraeota bacterium]